ncbi:hypothetical protein SLI_7324 [Streptomyces lividans 1326]|uniref:Uncharacterized protein n=1 Tax=Streptomyces lividans 1326 TaxID=1200984 RepID=A0A7U9E385_STRLI|nr:hypothetical protein SLI_7324 [Streptomyces lividans 1326]
MRGRTTMDGHRRGVDGRELLPVEILLGRQGGQLDPLGHGMAPVSSWYAVPADVRDDWMTGERPLL